MSDRIRQHQKSKSTQYRDALFKNPNRYTGMIAAGLVLYTLTNRENNKRFTITDAQLAEKLGSTDKTARKYKNDLVRYGHVRVVKPGINGYYGSIVDYSFLNFPRKKLLG